MSVDFYECKQCGEVYHEDLVMLVPTNIEREEIKICDYCIKDMIDDGLIEYYEEDDIKACDVEFSEYELDLLKEYGCYARYTEKGLNEKINVLNSKIEYYQKQKDAMSLLIDMTCKVLKAE